MKKIIILITTALFSTGFMFLSEDARKWKDRLYDRFPEIGFKINPNVRGFKTGTAEDVLNQTKQAASAWSYANTGAAAAIVYKGSSPSPDPRSLNPSFPQIPLDICSNPDRSSVQNLDNTVYFAGKEDADCTDVSCGFVWSCSDTKEVIHFDAVVNDSLFSLETGSPFSKSFRLSNVLLKQLGAVAGLYHCPAGDGNCSAGDPVPGSALFKFLVPENYSTSISQDDKNGMQALYGRLNDNEKALLNVRTDFRNRVPVFCQFPCISPDLDTNDKYKTSASEAAAWNEYIQVRSAAGLETQAEKRNLFLLFQDSYSLSYRQTGIPAEEYMLNSMDNSAFFLSEIPKELFDWYLKNLYVDLKNRERTVTDFKNELDPDYLEFAKHEYMALIQIRREMIDERLKR